MDDTTISIAYAAAVYEWRKSNQGKRLPGHEDWNLEGLVRKLSEALSTTYRSARTANASQIAGYIEVNHPKGTLFIPYNLISRFPSSQALDELVDQAEQVRFSPDNAVCISGSATFLDVEFPIGDLDYCEYFERGDRQIVDNVERILKAGPEAAYCASVWWTEDPQRRELDGTGQIMRTRPWADMNGLTQPLRSAFDGGGLGRGQILKADYVANSPIFDVIPVSNMGIPVDRAAIEKWATGFSHTAQEVALVPQGDPPRALALESGIGYYALWLRGEVDKHRGTPVKAAKRALSLTSLLLMKNEANALVGALLQPELASLTRRKTLDDIVKLVGKADDEAGERLRAEAARQLDNAGGAPTSSDYENVDKECATVTDKAIQAVDVALTTARKALASLVR